MLKRGGSLEGRFFLLLLSKNHKIVALQTVILLDFLFCQIVLLVRY